MDLAELIALFVGGGTIVFTIVIGLVTVVCTTLPFVAIGWYIYRRSKQSKQVLQASQVWPSTAGIIVKSRVEVSGGESASVNPRVVYDYVVGGQNYQNDQIRAGDDIMAIRAGGTAYDIVDRYPVGMAVIVFYNPANPAESALER
jgi:hypothetical protein